MTKVADSIKSASDRPTFEIDPSIVGAIASCLWGFDFREDSAQEKALEIYQEIVSLRHQLQSPKGRLISMRALSEQESPCSSQLCKELIVEKLGG